MKYINISEAAERWGVTVRRVQDLCKQGSIKGAVRFGRAWMIPENAEKPIDRRTRHAKQQKLKGNENYRFSMPRENPFLLHTDIYQTPGTAQEVIKQFDKYSETHKILQAQLDYRRGNIEALNRNVKYFLNEHGGFNSTISAGILLSFCAIWKGDINLWRQARQHIYAAPCKNENDRQIVEFWLAVVDSNINDTRQFPEWFENGRFDCLPADSYCTARAFYIKRLFISANDLASGKIEYKNVSGLGLMRTLPFMIEPMISQAKIEHTLMPEIYLHLMAATVYRNLGENEKAIEHVDVALRLAQPDRLFGILIEYRTGLDNLIDDRMALINEADAKEFKELYKQYHNGWLRLHNTLLERNVSGTLTTREREVARLAAFGLSNAEIAVRLHIEISSVKRYIFSAMNKVGAERRSELGLYI